MYAFSRRNQDVMPPLRQSVKVASIGFGVVLSENRFASFGIMP
jgi:hypothetical protein